MKITKLLLVNGATEPNAVMISDVNEEYPVFLESLHNAVYFNELLNSGYKLAGLPYNFVLNGNSIYQLPTEPYQASMEVQQEMYNYIGAPLPYDELKEKIDESVIVTKDTPNTNYTITTRTEFIEYLNNLKTVNLAEDFMPINYFVAPDARFTVSEYNSEVYADYVHILDARRNMSISKFHRLMEWLKKFGLRERPSIMDVLDGYFAWGIDGLDFPIISTRKEMRDAELTAGSAIPCYRKTPGLIDSKGNILTPSNDRSVHWELPSNDPAFIPNVTRDIEVGDSVVCQFKCRIQQESTVIEGTKFNAVYTQDRLVFLRTVHPTLRVTSPVTMGIIPLDLALPSNSKELWKRCYIEALSRMLYNKRKSRVHVSSYDALLICGTNPSTALNYIATQDEMDKLATEPDSITVMDYDIAAFLNGDMVSEQVVDYIDGVVSGLINIDSIAQAKEAESHVSTNESFEEIYALHYVMGIPLDEIYRKFAGITEEDKTITFSNDDYKHTMQVSQLRMSLNGYLSDIQSYDLRCVQECNVFNYVVNAAREVGVNECDRHVGIEFYMVLKNAAVRDVLYKLEEFYADKVTSSIANASERNQLLALSHMFSHARYYEIALNGTCTLPTKLGGGVLNATTEQVNYLRKFMKTKIENITTYCSYTVGGSTARDMTLDMYCVNAYITPERVIPRKGYTIHEAAFYALWNNYNRTMPELHAQLIGTGVIPSNFVSWSERYVDEQFVQRDMFDLDDNTSLTYYCEQADIEIEHYPKDQVFTSVTHPIDYMFPGLANMNEQEVETLSAPREGAVQVRLGFTRELTTDSLRKYLYPEVIESDEDDEQYMHTFRGFKAEAFDLCSDILSRTPSPEGTKVVVHSDNEHVYLPNQDKVIDYRNLPDYADEYGILNAYDRIYVFWSADGKLWEARI